MKKFISGIIVSMVLLGSLPGVAFAETTTPSLQALLDQINSLMKIVQDLQTQLASVQKQTVDYSIDQKIALVESMKLGSESEQVKALQALLAADADLYPEGLITGYYGRATEEAVKRFQKKHGLEAVGFIGPKTREKLNKEFEKYKFRFEDGDDNDDRNKKNPKIQYVKKFCIPPGHTVAPGWKRKNGNVDFYIIPFCNDKGTSTPPYGDDRDKVAPIMTNIVATPNVRYVTITWTTNEPATSHIKYGLTQDYTREEKREHNFVTSHSVVIDGLATSTTYNFKVRSRDRAGNVSESGNMTFTTLAQAGADVTAPTIGSISVTGVSMTGATIGWATNENADSQIEYGTSASLGSLTTLNGSLVTSHSQTLSGLSASTTYHYRVKSKDAAGNIGTSSIGTFTTSQLPADVTQPVISGISVTNISQNAATIGWTTDEAADTQVGYGTTSALGQVTTLVAALTTSHSQALTGLLPNTTYHFHVRSKDGSGNLAVSSSVTFTTLADTTAPTFTGISSGSVGSTTATITWTTNENANSKVYYGTANPLVLGGASFVTDPVLMTSHSLNLSGLTASTTYFYVVESADGVGNTGTGAQQSFTTGN